MGTDFRKEKDKMAMTLQRDVPKQGIAEHTDGGGICFY